LAQTPVRILQVGKFYPPRWGGMETALKDICETTRENVRLRVVVANEERRTERSLLKGVDVTRLGSFGTLFSQPLTPGLLGVLRDTEADVVHIHEPNPLAMTAFLMSRCRSRLVIHYHSDIVRQRRLKRFYGPILRAALHRADAIVVGSRELLDSSSVLSNFRDKCTVIPFGIDLSPFLRVERRTEPGLPLVLAVGRLSYYKGFHHLIEAIDGLRAKLVIVGEGEQRRFWKSRLALAAWERKSTW
jgi:glycosyltransferase involved in cell wall biosynthesis